MVCKYMAWTEMDQDEIQVRVLVMTLTNIQVP